MKTVPSQHALAPVARAREALFKHVGQAPRSVHNLWLVYSHKTRRQWLLSSDAAYLHFLDLEFDPDVRDFDLAPAPIDVARDELSHRIQFDAIVRRLDGTVESRRLTASDEPADPLQQELERVAAQRHNAHPVRLAVSLFATPTMRMQNSLRMLRFLQAALTYPLEPYRNSVLARLASQPSLSVEALTQASEPSAVPLVLAAVFELVQQRHLRLDLEAAPVTLASRVERVR